MDGILSDFAPVGSRCDGEVSGCRWHQPSGEVSVVGAKNSALKLMAGALLAVGRTRLSNVPSIIDVTIMAELLRRLGCAADWDPDGGVVELDVPEAVMH